MTARAVMFLSWTLPPTMPCVPWLYRAANTTWMVAKGVKARPRPGQKPAGRLIYLRS